MRFRKGDEVKYVVSSAKVNIEKYLGKRCRIRYVGPFKALQKLEDADGVIGTPKQAGDYVIDFAPAGIKKLLGVKDWQLQSLNPPKEPKAMKREQA